MQRKRKSQGKSLSLVIARKAGSDYPLLFKGKGKLKYFGCKFINALGINAFILFQNIA